MVTFNLSIYIIYVFYIFSCMDLVLNLPFSRYEPLSYLLGNEYFFHAYGPLYALSADVVASLATLRNNRQVY